MGQAYAFFAISGLKMDKTLARPKVDKKKFTRIYRSAHSICEIGLKHIKEHSSNLGMLFLQSQDVVLCGVATGQDSGTINRFIPLTGQLGAALFKLGNRCHPDCFYQLENDLEIVGTEPIDESELHEGNWLTAYYWNRIAGQQLQLKWLIEFPTEILTQSSTKGPKMHSALVNSLKAFEQNSRSLPQALEKAIAIGNDESRQTWVKHEGLPICKLLAAIHARQTNLTEVVREALAGHRKCAETLSVYRDGPEGLISVGVSALVKIARERGLAVDLESDFMPHVLAMPSG